MRKLSEIALHMFRWARYIMLAMFLVTQVPQSVYSQTTQSLEDVNDALAEETDNVIQTGRLISNIIVVISFVLLMLNIAFKVMDNSKATVIFLFILMLRGLYEVIF